MGQTTIEVGTDYLDFVTKIHRTMVSQNIILIYEGEFNQDITKVFTGMAEKSMDAVEENTKTSKRVFHVMVELLQNICKHSESPDKIANVGKGIFILGSDTDKYYVTSGNLIESDNLSHITGMIDEFNQLDPAEVKAKYKELMKASRISEKGGAGLGLIDIIKKTGNKIDYHSAVREDNYTFFVQRSTIDKIQ